MSNLRVTSLRGRTAGTSPTLPDGAIVTGVTTSTSFDGNLTGNVTGNVTGTATTATNLASAANITTGTIADARFPATLPAVSGANLTNLNIPAGFSELDAALFN
jgi:hypothetical protein